MSPTLTDLSTGIPPRVWQKAVARGLHDECVATAKPCTTCETTLMDAFEDVYGGAETMDEVLGMIAYDLAREHARELAS